MKEAVVQEVYLLRRLRVVAVHRKIRVMVIDRVVQDAWAADRK